jgi:hypothetical protein
MKSPQSPLLATWLLAHVLPAGKYDALTGDLLEEFGRGHSTGWYWCQALIAILVSLYSELRLRWLTVVFAIAVCCAPPWQQLWHRAQFQSFVYWGIKFPWPTSFFVVAASLSAFHASLLLPGPAIYLGATGSLQRCHFLKGFSLALLSLVVGNIGVMVLSVFRLPPPAFYYVIWRLPLFFAVVLATWVARPLAPRHFPPTSESELSQT